MLEPAVRESHFDKALSDPDIAVILLDVVLGFERILTLHE